MTGAAVDRMRETQSRTVGPSLQSARSECPDTTLAAADYGFLPREHRLVSNLNARIKRLFPDVSPNELPEVRVLASLGVGANAFCHQDGILIVTPELFKVLCYEEELDAILKHEGIHHRDGHIKESQRLMEDDGLYFLDIGAGRHHEIETDLRSFIEMADNRSKTNPFGYVSLLETLLALDKGAQTWDPDHGRLTDRILNLRTLISGYELSPGTHPLDHLSERELTPIDGQLTALAEDIKERGGKIGQLLKPASSDPQQLDQWIVQMNQRVTEAKKERNLPLLVTATNALIPRLIDLKSKVTYLDHYSCGALRYQGTMTLIKDLLSAIEHSQPKISPNKRPLIVALLISPDHCQKLKRLASTDTKPFPLVGEFLTMANNLTRQDLPKIPSQIWEIIRSGVTIRSKGTAKLVYFLANHLLIYNSAYDYPPDGPNAGRPNLSQFWREVTPVLREAYDVDAEQLGWSPDKRLREFASGLLDLAATGLKFLKELQASDSHPRLNNAVFLQQEEQDALRELLLARKRPLGSGRFPTKDEQLPVLDSVAPEIVELQILAETFLPQQLDGLIFRTLKMIHSLPPEFFAPLLVTPDTKNDFVDADDTDETDEPPKGRLSQSINQENTRIFRDTISGSLRDCIIERLNKSDVAQIDKGYLLIRYLQQSIGHPLWDDSAVFTKLFSGLPLDSLLDLPLKIDRIGATTTKEYPWHKFSCTDVAWSPYPAISSLQAKCLLQETDPRQFFINLGQAVRGIPPHMMSAPAKSNLFRHAVELLKQAPEKDIPYYGYLTSTLIIDYTVKRRIRAGFLEQLAQSKTVAEVVELATSQFTEDGPSDLLEALKILDKKATKPQEHQLIFDTLRNVTTNHRTAMIYAASAVVGAEWLAQMRGFNNRRRATEILLSTPRDDMPLREKIAQYWYTINEIPIRERLSEFASTSPTFDDLVARLKGTSILSEQDVFNRLKLWSKSGVVNSEMKFLSCPTPEGLLRALYSLSQQERLVVARELLLGENGLLKDQVGRLALHQMLMLSSVEGSQGSGVVSDAAFALLTEGALVQLAEGLVPLVAEQICKPPPTDVGWRRASSRAIKKNILIKSAIIDNLRRARSSDLAAWETNWIKEALCSGSITDKHRTKVFKLFVQVKFLGTDLHYSRELITRAFVTNFFQSPAGKEWLESLSKTSDSGSSRQKRIDIMQALLTPAVTKCISHTMSRPYRQQYDDISTGVQDSLVFLERISKPYAPIPTAVRGNSVDFIAQVAPKMGTPAVRLAQIAAQLLPLDPVDRRKLSGVFDSTAAQLACSAWSTLSRAEPELAEALTEFGPRLGGGSLNSVFYAMHRDFGPAVVKVLVPQAAHRAKSTFELIRTTQRKMENRTEHYQIGRQLVEVSERWVTGELGDSTYDEDDTAFRARFHGKKYLGLEIYIPKRLHTKTATVRFEEFVSGNNLTRSETMDGDLAKRAVAAGLQCYFDQITGTTIENIFKKDVLVLSDISPGNVRVTEDGKRLVILDRAFYQHITFHDRMFLRSIFKLKDAQELADAVAKYLTELGQAPNDPDNATSVLANILRERLKAGADESLISSISVDAYSAGFTFPLRLQLIARGMAAWRQMAIQVGFSSLQEAHSFSG